MSSAPPGVCLAITSEELASPASGARPWDALAEACARLAARLGPRAWILLRDGGAAGVRRDARVVRDRARAVVDRVAGFGARVIVADRLDVALALRDRGVGVQLPEGGVPVAEARGLAGDALPIGASRHDAAGAASAARAGADWITVGPIFPTPSKPGHPGIGLEGLAGVVRAVRASAASAERDVRVLALGGVDGARVAEVLAAGADGVAAIRAAWDDDQLATSLSV